MKYLDAEGNEFVNEIKCMGCNNVFLSIKSKEMCYCPDCKTRTEFIAFKNGKIYTQPEKLVRAHSR